MQNRWLGQSSERSVAVIQPWDDECSEFSVLQRHHVQLAVAARGSVTPAILKFYFRFRFRPQYRQRRVTCISVQNFIQIGQPNPELWRHIGFQDGDNDFRFGDLSRLRRSKTISMPNVDQIFQFTAKIWLLSVLKTTGRHVEILRPFSVWYDLFIVIFMWFSIRVLNCIPTARSATELWRHIDYSTFRPYCPKSTSGLQFGDVLHVGT